MPEYPNRQFLDFEQPIKDLYEQIDATKKLAEKILKLIYLQLLISWKNRSWTSEKQSQKAFRLGKGYN